MNDQGSFDKLIINAIAGARLEAMADAMHVAKFNEQPYSNLDVMSSRLLDLHEEIAGFANGAPEEDSVRLSMKLLVQSMFRLWHEGDPSFDVQPLKNGIE